MATPVKPALALVSPAARSTTSVSPVEGKELPDAAADALSLFEKVLGGRAAFIDQLAATPAASPEVDRVLHLLADPANDRTRLATLCHRAGFTPGEFFVALRSAKLAKAHLHSLSLAADRLPDLMTSLLVEALPHEILCARCDGMGEILPPATTRLPHPEPIACKRCKGSGRIVERGDLEAQKLVLELASFIKREKGTQINVNQQTQITPQAAGQGGGGGDALVQLQQAMSELLFSRAPTSTSSAAPEPIVEGIVVDAPLPSTEEEPSA